MDGNGIVSLTLSVVDQLSPVIKVMASATTLLVNSFSALSNVGGVLTGRFITLSGSFYNFLGDTNKLNDYLESFKQNIKGVGLDIDGLANSFSSFYKNVEGKKGGSLFHATEKKEIKQENNLTNTLTALQAPLSALVQGISPQLGGAFEAVTLAVKKFGGSAAGAFNEADRALLLLVRKIEIIPGRIAEAAGVASKAFAYLGGVREPIALFNDLKKGVTDTSLALFGMVQEFGLFGLGLQSLQQLVNTGPFHSLIGQNVELQQQLLATQSTLVATNRVFKGGQQITDNKTAILALQQPVEGAIEKLRQGSLELSNVTTKELVPVFNIVSGQAGNIGANLDQAVGLTLSFAAAMGTLGIPLYQANQEITSMLNGQIDNNSRLANALQINSAMVEQWKAQGILDQELTKKLQPLKDGNQLAADTVGNLGSNIKDTIDYIGQIAGKPLLSPVVSQLKEVFAYLSTNKASFSNYIGGLAQDGERAVRAVITSIKGLAAALSPIIAQIPVYLFQSLSNAAVSLSKAIATTIEVLKPAINLFAALAQGAIAAGGPMLDLFLKAKVLQFGISTLAGGFGTLFNIIPGVGEVMFLLSLRTNGLLTAFTGLGTVSSLGASGLLLLGQNLGRFPVLINAISGSIPLFGGAIAAVIPSISTFAIGLISLSNKFPAVGVALNELVNKSPAFINSLATMAGAKGFTGLSSSLQTASTRMAAYGGITGVATAINERFTFVVKEAGAALKAKLITMGFYVAAFVAAGYIINEFILKNKALLSTLGEYVGIFRTIVTAVFQFLIHPLTLAAAAVIALSVAIASNLIPSLIALKLTMLDLTLAGIAGVINGLGNMAKVFRAVGYSAGAAALGEVSLALSGIALAAAEGTLTVKFLTTSLYEAAAGMLVAFGPIVLIAALVAGFLALYASEQDKVEKNALNDVFKGTDKVIKGATIALDDLTEAQKRTNKAREAGIALTKEELLLNNKAVAKARIRISELDGERDGLEQDLDVAKGDKAKERLRKKIAEIDAQKTKLYDKLPSEVIQDDINRLNRGKELTTDEKEKDRYAEKIKFLEDLKTKKAALENEIVLEPLELPKYGTLAERLKQKSDLAEKAIDNPFGEEKVFKQKVQELVQGTQDELESGAISLDTAVKRFQKVIGASAIEDTALRLKALESLKKAIKDESEVRVAALESVAKFEQNQVDTGRSSAEAAEADITANKKAEIQERLNAIYKQLEAESAVFGTNSRAYKALINEKRDLEGQLTKTVEDELRKRQEFLLKNFEEERAILDARKAGGDIDQGRFLADAQAIAEARTKVELDELKRRQALLQEGDTEGLQAIEAERAKVISRAYEARQATLDGELKLIEVNEAKVQDVVAAAAQDRLTTISQELSAQNDTETQAANERSQVARDEAAQKLAIAQEYYRQLAAQTPPTDPEKAAEFEAKVRKAKLETAKLTGDLADKELSAQKALAASLQEQVDRHTKQMLNAISLETQHYDRQISLLNKQTDILKTQQNILEARSALQSSIGGFIDGQYKILIDTATSEKEKADLSNRAASQKLFYLQQEQKLKQISLELEIQQQRIADARALRESQRGILKATGEVRTAEAELKKKQLDPTALPEEIEALKLALQEKVAAIADLKIDQGLLIQGQGFNRQTEGLKRQELGLKQQVERDQARASYGATIQNKGDRDEYFENLRNGIYRRINTVEQDTRENRQIQIQNPIQTLQTPQLELTSTLKSLERSFNLVPIQTQLQTLITLENRIEQAMSSAMLHAVRPRVINNTIKADRGQIRDVLAGSGI